MASNKEEVLEGILQLPVLDIAWLVKELEDKFGVSAAAPVTVAAAPAAAASSLFLSHPALISSLVCP